MQLEISCSSQAILANALMTLSSRSVDSEFVSI